MALAVAPAAASRPSGPQPFTLPHFRAWASDLILDTGESWVPEDFIEAFLEELFAGVPECWLVVPEGNTKTTSVAGITLYHSEYRPFAVIPWAAASREQAEIGYKQAEGFVFRSPRLYEPVHSVIQAAKGKRKTEIPRFVCLEGYRRINHVGGSRIQVFAADDKTGDGIIPTLGVVDEPQRQKDLSLYRTWSGKLLKRDGQIIIISTSGEPGSDFELTRKRIKESAVTFQRNGSFVRAAAGRVVLHDWALQEDEDPDDMAAVKRCNPFSGITRESLQEKRDTPTMTLHHWLRFVCNRPDPAATSWLGEEGAATWKALSDDFKLTPGARTWVGVDVGIKRDSTAVVAVQQDADGLYRVNSRFWIPTEDQPVDVTDVMEHLRELDRTFDLMAVSYDPRFFDVPAKMLSDSGLLMVEVPQSVERMTPICGALFEIIKRGELRHNGDETLTIHVLNAVPRFNERGFTLQKSKSRGRIDGVIALALAVDRALHGEPDKEPRFAFA